jgi:nucleotide-binding universal stress UspA family protein
MNRFADKPILVPVDFSDEADGAVNVALEIANAPEQITMVHVAPPTGAFEPGVVYVIDDDDRRERILEAVKKRYGHAKYRGLHCNVMFGDPGHEIAKFAKELRAGLVVMPSHGRTGLAHLLIGSVAERVVRLAHCPVLVLRS